MTSNGTSVRRLAAVLLMTTLPAFATAPSSFTGELDPYPFDTGRANVMGGGDITATLTGRTLAISGTFAGLPSNATAAQLRIGLAEGVPGDIVGTLSVTAAASGQVSGSVTLTPAQVAALRKKSLYVEIDSIKAPDGNLWAFLEPTEK